MKRRVLLHVLLALAVAGPLFGAAPAFAEDSRDKSESEESSSGSASDSGSDDSSEDSSDDGKDSEDEDPEDEDSEDEESQSHDDALREVAANRAIPLTKMLAIFATYGELTVIDVLLVRRANQLQYKFKYIDPEGHVREAYFDALTGELVKS